MDSDDFSRLNDADVIFLSQDGHRLAPARVRCYHFAEALSRRGLRCEVLSFFDHLGAADQGGPVAGIDEAEKLRLNLRAFEALSRNPRAVLYVQKTGYHAVAAMLAASLNGNRYVLDYDDHDLDGHPFRRLEARLPVLAPEPLLATTARGAAACVAASRRILDLIRPHNPETHLIHTVADAEVFSIEGRDHPRGRFGDAVNILWCGDVWGDLPMADILFAIDAFAWMPAATRAAARFHVIGFGRAWEALKERVRARHPDLTDAGGGDGGARIVFHERIEPAAFGGVLREMDIGVLPYADNAFNASKSPTKMFEYLLAGVAVCATPVGEVVHCLTDGETASFGRGLEGYSHALASLIEDGAKRRRLAAAAHALALETYTLDGIAPRLEAIIRDIAGRDVEDGAATGGVIEDAGTFLARRLGRPIRVAPREVFLARRDLATLAGMSPTEREGTEPRMWSAPMLALLDWPGLAADGGLDAGTIASLRRDGARLRNAARLRPVIDSAPPRPPGPPSTSKLASSADWDDPAWFAWATRFKVNLSTFRPEAAEGDFRALYDDDHLNQVANYFKRSRGAWERIQWLYGLDRLGFLKPGTAALMACDHPDGFYLALTEFVGRVGVLDLSEEAGGHGARVAAGEMDAWLMKPRPFDRRRVTVDHVGPFGLEGPGSEGEKADVVIAPRDVIARIGVSGFLDWAASRMAPGGVVAFAAEVSLDGGATDGEGVVREAGRPSVRDVARAVAARGEFRMEGTFDASLDDATLDRVVVTGTPGAANPHFVVRDGMGVGTSAVYFLIRKAG